MFSKVVANCKIYCVPNSCKVPSSNLEVTRCFQAQVGAVGVVTSRVKSIYNLAKSIFRTRKRRYLSFKGIYYRSRTWKASEKNYPSCCFVTALWLLGVHHFAKADCC